MVYGFLIGCIALFAFNGCKTVPGSQTDLYTSQTLPLPPLKSDFAQALALFAQGYEHELRAEYDKALSYYEQSIDFDPKNEPLYLRMANHYLNAFQPDQAITTLQKLVERNPRSVPASLSLAETYETTQQWGKAALAYKKTIKLDPSSTPAYVHLASALLQEKQEAEAIQWLKRAIKKTEKPSISLRALGSLFIHKTSTSKTPEEEAENRKAAIDYYQKAVKKDHEHLSTLLKLADLYAIDNQLDKAIQLYNQAGDLHPENLPIKRKIAFTYLAQGKQSKAVKTLEEIADQQPSNKKVYMYLGALYEKAGDTEKAMSNFRLAAKHSDTDPAPFLKLAILQMEENPEAAEKVLLEGLEVLPKNIRLTEMLAYIYLNNKAYAKAADYFSRTRDQLARINPKIPTIELDFYHGIANQYSGNFEEAATELIEAIVKSPVLLGAYWQFTLQEPDQKIEVIALLEKIHESLPNNPTPLIYIALLHNQKQAYKKAISSFEKAEQLVKEGGASPSLTASFYFWYGASCEREGELERAESLFNECIKLDPDYAEAYNYLAYMWAEKGINLEQAFMYVTKALNVNPDSGAFLDTLGWIYFRQGNYADALEKIEKAASILPSDPTIIDHLGDIFLKLGQADQAVFYWQEAFMIDPHNTGTATKLKEYGIEIDGLRKKAEAKKRVDHSIERQNDLFHDSPTR
ncbi:MAG: tetratricopeptide repeat protein [Kiritimatiellae bacterium]|nr:tetratricopeptide repeat protein [Kiritimatiellia bacterium]